MKIELTVENKIANELNNGSELSERKLAEKYEVSRSVVRRVKADIKSYTVEIIGENKDTPVINQTFGIDNIEKLLASKSAHKKPGEISMIIFKRSEGDFSLFSKQMDGKTKYYIRDQFLRCVNATRNKDETNDS
ncbi:GntR family transcriptional regulator [Kluyvera intermedia]|uniref:GntR family transcriptional regulator n=1 Tax=Kluyvera intermedia TaxID=61648 RepID=UPI003709FCE0